VARRRCRIAPASAFLSARSLLRGKCSEQLVRPRSSCQASLRPSPN
jgi:hypothetical protein